MAFSVKNAIFGEKMALFGEKNGIFIEKMAISVKIAFLLGKNFSKLDFGFS